MKKILSLVLVVAMMASAFVFAPVASASTGATVEVTDAAASIGATVSVDVVVTMPDSGDLYSFQLAVDYDESRLDVVMNGKMVGTAQGKFEAGAYFPNDALSDVEKLYADGAIASAVSTAVDASEGYLVATLTFVVKDGAPLGDAYVRVAPIPDNDQIYVNPESEDSAKLTNWDVIDGNVTVLPKGAIPVPSDDLWDFDSETGTIYGYLGETLSGDIAIPSQIGGVDVVEIYADGASVIDGLDVTSIVIPATVEYINKGAFFNLASCTAIYVLNPDCEIEDGAMGYDGSWKRSKANITGQTLDADENTLLTLYGYAGSTAQTYAETGDGEYPFGWEVLAEAPSIVTTVAGNSSSSYLVSGATITAAPGASRVDGKSVIAWQVGEDVYAPGAKVAIDGNTTFTAITAPTPVTVHGASIKAADGYAALRFTAEFSIEEYEALVTAFGAGNVKHGMLISTQDQIEAKGAFTHAALGKAVIDFEMKGCWMKENGNYVLAASIKDFSESTRANNYKFNAVAYVGIDLDGDSTVDTYVYGDYDWTCARDAKSTLYKAINDPDTKLVGDQITWATDWYDKFN